MTLEEKLAELEAKKQKLLEALDDKIVFVHVPCEYCKEQYLPKTVVQKYCSATCRNRARPDKNKGKIYNKGVKKCPKCGKEHEHKGHNHLGRFCSHQCKRTYNRGVNPTSGEWFICLDCRGSYLRQSHRRVRCEACSIKHEKELQAAREKRHYQNNIETERAKRAKGMREKRALLKTPISDEYKSI